MAGRRGHGEGSIYKRKIGGKVVGWVAMLDLGYENGKRKRQAIYGRDRSSHCPVVTFGPPTNRPRRRLCRASSSLV